MDLLEYRSTCTSTPLVLVSTCYAGAQKKVKSMCARFVSIHFQTDSARNIIEHLEWGHLPNLRLHLAHHTWLRERTLLITRPRTTPINLLVPFRSSAGKEPVANRLSKRLPAYRPGSIVPIRTLLWLYPTYHTVLIPCVVCNGICVCVLTVYEERARGGYSKCIRVV